MSKYSVLSFVYLFQLVPVGALILSTYLFDEDCGE
jgi:hypothetical protein